MGHLYFLIHLLVFLPILTIISDFLLYKRNHNYCFFSALQQHQAPHIFLHHQITILLFLWHSNPNTITKRSFFQDQNNTKNPTSDRTHFFFFLSLDPVSQTYTTS